MARPTSWTRRPGSGIIGAAAHQAQINRAGTPQTRRSASTLPAESLGYNPTTGEDYETFMLDLDSLNDENVLLG